MDVLQRLVTQNEAALDAHHPCSAANGSADCGTRRKPKTCPAPLYIVARGISWGELKTPVSSLRSEFVFTFYRCSLCFTNSR